MPELPEVETTRRGIYAPLKQQRITAIQVRQPKLRWPIPTDLAQILTGQVVQDVTRRGKYLLLHTAPGTVLIHLGMSGCLRVIDTQVAAAKHDHVDIHFGDRMLRFTDPRRFGALLFTRDDPQQHPLLSKLGPEPLAADFNARYLAQRAEQRRVAIKPFIMDSHIVVGVGNIYATESLFAAGIHPQRSAASLSVAEYAAVVKHIKRILNIAIEQGGTTLKDFKKTDGKPGYFQQHLQVYGRAGQTCPRCQDTLQLCRQAQRSTVWCPSCQPEEITLCE